MSRDGATLSFRYDHNALRTQKIVQTDWLPETTNYFLHGKLINHMNVEYYDWDEVQHIDKLHFFYDAQSRPAQVDFNGVIYTYIHNLQGDIVGILDNSGVLVVEYKYDAWGKLLSVTGNLADTLGKRNPFRYRGYIYDEETGLYYLRSRYYNPTVGRFVNADTLLGNVGALGSHNLFAYCANNPVPVTDPDGYRYTYDAIDAYAKPPATMEQVADFFDRISKISNRDFNYKKFGNGSFSYSSSTKVVAYSDAEIVLNKLASLGGSAALAYVSTALITDPLAGTGVAVAQYAISDVLGWAKAVSVPSIPEGVYTHEVVEYKKDSPGFFGYTFTYTHHYLHGYDASGCSYFAVWSELYSCSAFGSEYHSTVISQRT